MKKLSQLALFLIVSLLFTACSQGYYAHVPRAKKAYTKTEVQPAETQTVTAETEPVTETAQAEEVKETGILTSEEVVTTTLAAEQAVVTESAAPTTVEKIAKMPALVKKVITNKVNRITEKLEPTETGKTQNVSNNTAVLMIVIGLVISILVDGIVGQIGYLILVIGLILLILNLLGVGY